MYEIKRPSRSEFIALRQQNYHVRRWGTPIPGQAPLVLLHGWMDVSASWQFVVDAMSAERDIIAPDWRGFGLTSGAPVESYWFPDYMADLEALLDHYAPDTPVDILSHSMGGNISMLYAGVRPQRIRRLINMEGYGWINSKASQAPSRYALWLDQVKALQQGEMNLRSYPEVSGVAQRLRKTNPRLNADKALWLAQHWAQQNAAGEWEILGAPAHKLVSAYLYRADEVEATFAQISADTLWVEASDNHLAQFGEEEAPYRVDHMQRLNAVPKLEMAKIADCSHMLHHDQPAEVARLAEAFLAKP